MDKFVHMTQYKFQKNTDLFVGLSWWVHVGPKISTGWTCDGFQNGNHKKTKQLIGW